MPQDKSKRFGLFRRTASQPTSRSAWGIDLGRSSLKAIKLNLGDAGETIVTAWDYIEHDAAEWAADVDRLKATLARFLERHNVNDDALCVTIPGHKVLSRIIALPKVEPKKLPDLMQYEVQQQIPLPLANLTWVFECMASSTPSNDEREMEVLLLAAKTATIESHLHAFTELGLQVQILQCDCVAWHNFLAYDWFAPRENREVAAAGPIAVLDLGVEASNLVVSDGRSLWTRTLAVGGLDFTKALARSRGLDLPQAEAMKRSPGLAVYEVDQGMEPAFQKLLREVAGSLEYYSQLPGRSAIKGMLVVGGGADLHGLIKDLRLGRAVNPASA